MTQRRTDIVAAALLFVAGLCVIGWVIPTFVAVPLRSDGDLSPAFMPYVAAILTTGAAGLMLMSLILRKSADDDDPEPLPRESWLFMAGTVLVLALTYALMNYAGYLYAGAVIVAGFMALARADLKVVVGTALAFPVVLWILFDKLLGFPLP